MKKHYIPCKNPKTSNSTCTNTGKGSTYLWGYLHTIISPPLIVVSLWNKTLSFEMLAILELASFRSFCSKGKLRCVRCYVGAVVDSWKLVPKTAKSVKRDSWVVFLRDSTATDAKMHCLIPALCFNETFFLLLLHFMGFSCCFYLHLLMTFIFF